MTTEPHDQPLLLVAYFGERGVYADDGWSIETPAGDPHPEHITIELAVRLYANAHEWELGDGDPWDPAGDGWWRVVDVVKPDDPRYGQIIALLAAARLSGVKNGEECPDDISAGFDQLFADLPRPVTPVIGNTQ